MDVVTIPSNIIKEAKNIIVGRNGIDISYEKERCHFIELWKIVLERIVSVDVSEEADLSQVKRIVKN